MILAYKFPKLNREAFHCPRCGVYSHQDWSNVEKSGYSIFLAPEPDSSKPNPNTIKETRVAICEHCKEFTLWIGGSMIYPLTGDSPYPSSDMPKGVKKFYEEARSIVSRSPRGAAALLRLATEKLTNDILGTEKGKSLNDNIRIMVSNGLREDVQQSLDSLRVIGNHAVHPIGEINTKDARMRIHYLNFLI